MMEASVGCCYLQYKSMDCEELVPSGGASEQVGVFRFWCALILGQLGIRPGLFRITCPDNKLISSSG